MKCFKIPANALPAAVAAAPTPMPAAAPAPASVVQNAMYSGGNNNAMNSGLISYKRPVSEIEQYQFAKTPEGGNFKGTLAEFKTLSKPTAEIEQYEYAKKNGYKGTFEQFKVLSTPKTTVSVSNVQEREEAKRKVKDSVQMKLSF